MTVLFTERLELRPVAADDLGVLLRHWNEPDLRSPLFAPVDPEEAEALLRDSEDAFTRYGYALWKVLLEGAVIGVCGLRRPEDDWVELLYSLDDDALDLQQAAVRMFGVALPGRDGGLRRQLLTF